MTRTFKVRLFKLVGQRVKLFDVITMDSPNECRQYISNSDYLSLISADKIKRGLIYYDWS